MGDDLTHDAFLGGRLHLWQPKRGYRAGVDPVILAAAQPAATGQTVLDLGCGVGTALLCLGARVPGLGLTGIEVQDTYAALARRNAGKGAEIIAADLRELPDAVRLRQFDHVMMNPPYFDRAQGDNAQDAGRDTGRGGDTPLAEWLDVGCRRLAPKGTLGLIQHISRLPEVLALLQTRLGGLVVKPIVPRDRACAGHFLLQGRLGSRAPFVMAAPLIMHEIEKNDPRAETYTPMVAGILRDAASLPLGN